MLGLGMLTIMALGKEGYMLGLWTPPYFNIIMFIIIICCMV
jgi:hypothetical protein